MATSTMDICPRCKGHMMLEKDNYGLYQQCLQCGYLHDLQTFPNFAREETEEKAIVAPNVSANDSQARLPDTARLTEGYHKTALADPLDLRLILGALQIIERENRL